MGAIWTEIGAILDAMGAIWTEIGWINIKRQAARAPEVSQDPSDGKFHHEATHGTTVQSLPID
jgi:hypothetical protein